MSWKCVQVIYELISPLHVGYHKVGNVQRTRYYLPARNLWGAATEKLTRCGFEIDSVPMGDYKQIGAWTKNHLAFTYFFLLHGTNLLYPRFCERGLCYGSAESNLREYGFERLYLSSHVTTSLDAATTSAEPNSLHEVEFLATHCKVDFCQGSRTKLQGWVFLDEVASQVLGNKDDWEHWLGEMYVGGERRYGFGKLRLIENGWTEVSNERILSNYNIKLNRLRPQIEADKHKPVLAHTIVSNVQGKGLIEPLVGRETDTRNSRAFGCNLTRGKICWVPGTLIESATTFQINHEGIWEVIISKAANKTQKEENETS